MSAEQSTQEGRSLTDALGQRLRWAVLASVLINMMIWRAAAAIARRPAHYNPPPVEITRVILDKGRKIPKVVTKKQIQKRIAHIRKITPVHRPAPRPRPVVHVVHHPRPVPVARPRPPRPTHVAQRPPQGAHHRLLTALPGKGPANPAELAVQAGGNAELGKPIERENPGNAVVNPPAPVEQKPVPPAPPPPPPPPPAPKPAKVAEAPAPVPEPAPEPPPKRHGPTRDAEPEEQVNPSIPDELKQGEYRSFVRVRVEVDADGTATPILRTSSGNPEIDRRVLDALKRWRWKPALREGEPVKSTKLFKFEFEVQ
jgi:protein TonB